ncbi:MAG: nucleotidyltransferase domain-containing protein [Ignavibacteriaceae bacterium]|nr:nucleotidyltransferase domain-containing protein [Ignavibacterium sp.]MCC6255244.1 nucleotidyltransferase domain-containing protein [Ignavibacteriaceae bacterium]HRN26113.1 nucleotidyltransferase domain-containing protein [Ignavibacteriaceae bacterium]HRP92593.1 nucleotidyltransferase domain-containing protein [Ignavibacteriaceae bacterium]HRQ53722.1 nucleotidyltransferase domain-containing protein [Ignavibacteriaceae bacterium]
MIVHKILNEIFSTYSNVAVLRALQDNKLGASGREISKKAGLSAPSCLQALTKLEKLNLVIRQKGGRDHLFTLNIDSVILNEAILPILDFERNLLSKIQSEIKKTIGKLSLSLILFGSVARIEENYESDFDVAVIVKNSENKLKIEDKLTTLILNLKKRFGINLSTIIFTQKEFMKKIKSKSPPANNIVEDGIVFSGLSIRRILND